MLRLPRRFSLRGSVMGGATAFLCISGSLAASAQVKPSRGAYGLCEPVVFTAGTMDRPQEDMHYPAWDVARFNPADNRQIAALRTELDSAGFLHRHLFVLNRATQRRKLLVRDVGCALSWSSAGWLVLERAGELWKLKATGDSLTRLTARSTNSTQPVWSPSGRLLACLQAQSEGGVPSDIVLLAADGRQVKRLPLGSVSPAGAPTWAPDGRKLAFWGMDGQRDNLYEYDIRTHRIRIVFAFPSPQYKRHSVHWLPNGRELVWRETDRGLTVINLTTGRQRTAWAWRGMVYPLSLDLDATGRRALVVSAEGRAFNPDNPREGGYLVSVLFITNLDGSRKVEIK